MSFFTKNVNNIKNLFGNLKKLKTIPKKFIEKVKNKEYIIEGCESLDKKN